MSHPIMLSESWAERLAQIEAATFDALPPQERVQVGPWQVGLDPGTVSRAHSAAPVRLGPELIETLPEVIDLYRAARQTPTLRLADLPALEPLRRHLRSIDYHPSAATWVQHADCETVQAQLAQPPGTSTSFNADPQPAGPPLQVRVEDTASDAWCEIFLGQGFDPVDGASRTAILRRARSAQYASVVAKGRVIAVGMGSYSQGWASIHGMRTHPDWRKQGLARSLINALLSEAKARHLSRVFLQVEASNSGAHRLYCRIGFEDLWTYRYWRPKVST